jgi:hypothetical protein
VFSLTSLDLSYNQRLGDRGVKELAALVNLRQVRYCGGWGVRLARTVQKHGMHLLGES